jgi:hypothetical protein
LSLLQGKFEYTDVGILDRTHLRFFTLESILRLFTDAGFAIVDLQRVRQDPFKEPYIDRPQMNQPELRPDLKRLIEDDPDAATVQFVVKAFPVDSSAAQLRMLQTLQAQIQEKEKTVLNLEKILSDLRNAMEERDHTVSSLKDQIQTLHSHIEDFRKQIESSRQQADGALRARESVIRELQASNEKLTGWLTKYTNAKEKLLPTGSLRDRAARKLAGILLTKSAPAQKPYSEPEPSERR